LPWASVTVPLVLGLSATGTEVTFTDGRSIRWPRCCLGWGWLRSAGFLPPVAGLE
jgi:hypothetical protein